MSKLGDFRQDAAITFRGGVYFHFHHDPNLSQNVRAGLVLNLCGKHQSEPSWTSRSLLQVDNCHLLMQTLGSISQMCSDVCGIGKILLYGISGQI